MIRHVIMVILQYVICRCSDGNCLLALDNGDCGGSSVEDECGICDGDNSSCLDDCGVPNGDNSTCSGCMDSWACNYDSDATIDNGECEYLNDPIVSMTDYEWVLEYENGCYGEPTEISGSFILTFFNNNTWSNQNGVTGQWSLCGNTLVRFLGDDPEGNYIFEGSFDGTQFSGYYDESIVTDYGCFTLTPIINGCTDTVACNYDSTANTNDGSCEYISCLDECGVWR